MLTYHVQSLFWFRRVQRKIVSWWWIFFETTLLNIESECEANEIIGKIIWVTQRVSLSFLAPMLFSCFQLLCRPRQFQLKLYTEGHRRRGPGMAWPEQLSFSQKWTKLSVSQMTGDVCRCLITTQCLFYSILYLGGKKIISHHFHTIGFSSYVAMEICYFLILTHTHT
jgi:hypothetical protein